MDNMNLGLGGSPGSAKGPWHELPSAGSPERCIDEGRVGGGCEAEACPSTTASMTGCSANAVEQAADEFDVVGEYLLQCNCEGVGESMERSVSLSCNSNADLVDLENGTGAVPPWNQTECENENGLCVEEDEGRVSAVEGDVDGGTPSKGPAEEGDSLCLSSSRILLGCELQTSSANVAGAGRLVHLEGDERCKEYEVDVRSARLPTVTGEGEVVSLDGDKECNECEFAIARQLSLTTDCSSVNSSSKPVEEFCCNFLLQDGKITSVNSGTKSIDETCGNSSEVVQRINTKDDSVVAAVPCVVANCLEQDYEKPSMDVSVEQNGEKNTDAPTDSEERDTHVSIRPEKKESVVQVHHEHEACQASSIERESCDLVEGLPGTVTSSCAIQEIASLQPSHLSSASEDCPSGLHSVSGNKVDTVAASISSTCCGHAAECCTQEESCGKTDCKSGTVLVVRRRNPKRAASSRNNQCTTKSDPPTRSRNSAEKGRLAVNICALLSCGTFKRVTKKRCHSWKRARGSVWGELGNLLELFKHNDEPSQSKNKGSKKGRCCREGRWQLKNRRAGRSHRPRAMHIVSTNHVILQDGMDQQMPAANSQTSLHTSSDNCSHKSDLPTIQVLPKAVNGVENLSETGGCSGLLACHYRDLENQVMSHEQHPQHGDKDPESSVTQEASVENTVSDCHGVQSQKGQGALLEAADGELLLDAGTSPDSGVLHPIADAENITNEVATSTSHEPSSKVEVIGQNIFELGSPVQEDLNAGVSKFSQVPRSVSLQSIQHGKKAKRRGKVNWKKNGKIEENGCLSSDNSFEGTSQGPCSLLKTEKPSRSRSRQRKKDDSGPRKVANRRSIVKASEDIQEINRLSAEHPFLGVTDPACCQGYLMSENCLESNALSAMSTRTAGSQSMFPENLSSSSVGKGQKLHGGNKSGRRKSNSSAQQGRRKTNTRKKDNTNNLVSRRKAKKKMVHDQVFIMEECRTHDALNAEQGGLSHLISGMNLTVSKPDESDKVNILQSDQLRDDESNSGDKHASRHALSSLAASVNDDLAKKGSSHTSQGKLLPKRSAWVRCDDCYKWRSIPVELADTIDETNCRWTCKDNSDKAFADCMIPQEKTNAQINAELEISDASCEDDSFTEPNCKASEMKAAASKQSSWALVKSNIFLHRTRKTQTIDEIMVCQCKPPLDGNLGCGDECLNRMLNIECVPEACPCGNLCSNQQFQKCKYAKFKWFRCGKKGFGLQLLEDVSQGQFLIEYVGEVLDLTAYEARQREYAARGQKHFYFMTLNGSEVIDACAKGNLGRFINHSCEPNCRTEKWMINGEVCIGLFAIRDIKKDEEITFDYNYVRVFGAAAKRCVCGSTECRGYIGGDPLNTEIIVQGDSDEEYPEPVMIVEDGEAELNVDEIISESMDASDLLHDISVQGAGKASKTPVVGPKVEITLQTDDTSLRSSSAGQLLETLSSASKSKTVSETFLDNNKCLHGTGGNNPHNSGSLPHGKSSRLGCSVKKKSCSSNKSVVQNGKKSSIPLTQSTVSRAGRFEGVEEKLNELLDAQGGISKRRDATKGYLKLLFLTASSGDNVKSETSQSTRDLSLILDAILKTKSKTVLADIINKNGLQMLHNIMKQNRKNFNKIPILRKLLKVLEFLAVREILTHKHINNIPSHERVESFKASINQLTRHNDVQVHQMAKNFQNKWVPRIIRKVHLSDRENGWLNSKRANSNWFLPSSFKHSQIQGVRDTDAICLSQTDHVPSPSHGTAPSEISSFSSEVASTSVPSVDVNSTAVAKPRKRKSRWDQPSDALSLNLQVPSIEEWTEEASPKVMRCTSTSAKEATRLSDGTVSSNDMIPQGIDEVPPGFGPPASNTHPWIRPDISMVGNVVVAGHAQERYCPQLTVSYGIPWTLVEQLGTADAGASDNRHHRSWVIAPGMPFQPFPPLPPFPRGGTSPAPSHSSKGVESTEESRPTDSTPNQLDSSTGNESVERAPIAPENGAVSRQPPEKTNWSPNGFKKKFFRPHRWNGHRYEKFGPPWPRERNCCTSRGIMRNGMSSVAVGSIQKKMGHGFCFTEDVRGENVSSTFSELPHQVQ